MARFDAYLCDAKLHKNSTIKTAPEGLKDAAKTSHCSRA